ncbi:MAG: hydroxyacylglutathione hydrolase [Sandaracinaceae bacterium]
MEHVVSRPHPPFRSADGTLEVHQVPAWKDNFVWLAVQPSSREAAAVDGPEAAPVLAYCDAHGLKLTAILNTHTHPDHIGINQDLSRRGQLDGMRVVGPRRKASSVPGLTEPVDDGDRVTLGDAEGDVWLTEGHIDGHVSYIFGDVLFCGDTLFAAGCGYLFDGPPEKMHASLARLRTLPSETRVCCAHEYTEDNLRFAWSVDPDNEALAERIRRVWAIREDGGATVPSTIGEERATNPFLRFDDPALRARIQQAWPDRTLDTDQAVFAATRALKDRKDYRKSSDDTLPL